MRARSCPFVPTRLFHGKEGVVGSSPTEGLDESPAISYFIASEMPRAAGGRAVMEALWKPKGCSRLGRAPMNSQATPITAESEPTRYESSRLRWCNASSSSS